MRLAQKRILANTAIQVLGKGLDLGLSLLTTAILTRKLGVSGWGNWVLLTAVVVLLAALADWGSQIIGVREFSCKKNKNEVFASLLVLRLGLVAFAGVVGAGLIYLFPFFSNLRPFVGAIFLVLLFLSLVTTFEVIFQANLRMEVKVILDLVYRLFFLLFLLPSQNLVQVVWVWMLAWWIRAVLAGWLGWHFLPPGDFRPRFFLLRFLTSESLPLGALLLIFTLYDRAIDSFFLQAFWGASTVGWYGLAYRIYTNAVLPAYFFVNSLFPFLAKTQKRDAFFSWLIWGSRWLLLVGGLAAVLLFVFSPKLILLLAGEEFIPSILLLRLLSLGIVFAWGNHLTGFGLVASGRQTISLKIGILALFWNAVLNLIFIPHFGAPAAAVITVTTEGLVLFCSGLALARVVK